MLSEKAFQDGMVILFLAFPVRKPTGTPKEAKTSYQFLYKSFESIPDDIFLKAVEAFVLKTPTLYPGDNFMAMIREIAMPRNIETPGDCLEIIWEAVQKFSSDEPGAMTWISSKSALIAATIKRYGYQEFCRSQNIDLARNQLMKIFLGEKERAEKTGRVLFSALQLQGGDFPALPAPE